MKTTISALALLAGMQGSLADSPIQLPLHFENKIPVVTLRIGDRDLPFTLDTGASDALYVNEEVEHAIPGLTRTGRQLKSMDLGGKVALNEEVSVRDLVVDGMHFGTRTGRTLTPWGMSADGSLPPPRISVLGSHFFDGKKVLFDFSAGRLTVWNDSSNGLADVSNWKSIPYERTSEGYVVALESSMQNYHVVLDSASTISLIKRTSIAPSEPETDCDIQFKPGDRCRKLKVRLPGESLALELYAMDFPPRFEADGLVGRAFFDIYQVYLDDVRHVLSVRQTKTR